MPTKQQQEPSSHTLGAAGFLAEESNRHSPNVKVNKRKTSWFTIRTYTLVVVWYESRHDRTKAWKEKNYEHRER